MDDIDQALEFEPGGFLDPDLDDQDLLAAAIQAEERL